jgi:ribosomal protein L14
MIQLKTFLKVIDNSGALVVECINVMGGSRIASVGDEIVCSVKKAKPGVLDSKQQKLKKGDVSRALVVRQVKEIGRLDGSFIKFEDNAVVMLNKQGQPLGNRVLGPIALECRQKRWAKVASLAPRLL